MSHRSIHPYMIHYSTISPVLSKPFINKAREIGCWSSSWTPGKRAARQKDEDMSQLSNPHYHFCQCHYCCWSRSGLLEEVLIDCTRYDMSHLSKPHKAAIKICSFVLKCAEDSIALCYVCSLDQTNGHKVLNLQLIPRQTKLQHDLIGLSTGVVVTPSWLKDLDL